MTIKIQAYQKEGIKTNKIVDEYEFCCWDALNKWLNSGFVLYKCPECNTLSRFKNGRKTNSNM
jgi:hypothetical protein